MKIFITGGNGFLGKHILPKLHFTNNEIWAPTSKQLDVLNRDQLFDNLCQFKPDVILHMAAKCAGIKGNSNNPAIFLRDNTQMALNIYEAARETNVKLVYSLGSVCAYPKFCPTPFKEDDLWKGYPEETNAPYGIAKRTLMMLGQTYRQQYDIGGAHLIPVNMYGKHDNFGDLVNSHVIPALIRKFVHAKDNNFPIVEAWGTGTGATREFLFAEDCAEAIVKAIAMKLDTDLPINLGAGKDISIYDLAHLIKDLVGYAGSIVFTGELDGQPKRLLDVSRAKKLLGWTAQTSLIDGLKQTIAWYQENR